MKISDEMSGRLKEVNSAKDLCNPTMHHYLHHSFCGVRIQSKIIWSVWLHEHDEMVWQLTRPTPTTWKAKKYNN